MVVSACVSTTNDSNDTSSSTQICDQSCQDNLVGYALDETLWLLWNENLAGHPSGNQDITADCPLEGTVHVTGTTGVASNGINTVRLTLELANCGNSNSSYSLSFSGTMTWNGTFSSTGPNAVTYQSSSMLISGTVKRYDNPAISETCAVALTDTYDKSVAGQRGWLDGELCKRTVID